MELPKILMRLLRPYLALLTIIMIYLAYHQFKQSESQVYHQSQSNIITASSLVHAQIEAVYSKFYLLEKSLLSSNLNPNNEDSEKITQHILSHSSNYSNILFWRRNHSTLVDLSGKQQTINPYKLYWHPLKTVRDKFEISSIYQNNKNRWVFAVRHANPALDGQLWIEFDLLFTTQYLKGLKTLENGYVFVVEKATGKLVFHPDPNRIGTHSFSFNSGIAQQIAQGIQSGKHEYYYRDNFKLTVFEADNDLDWIFVAGTDRSDILSSSNQFSLTALVIASLIGFTIVIHYLAYQLVEELSRLGQAKTVVEFKQQLKLLFDRFCPHSGVQFCLYDNANHLFSTLDYHGNKKPLLHDVSLASQFTSLSHHRHSDALTLKLKVHGHHYRMPLFDGTSLLAVVYIRQRFPMQKAIMILIQNYAQTALANLLLHQQLRHQDPMTQLENKASLANAMQRELEQENIYFAMLNIDNFKRINDSFGHPVGDIVIRKTAQLLRDSFQKPHGLCIARYGSEEFAVLFRACDETEAKAQLDTLRQAISHTRLLEAGLPVAYSISVGMTKLEQSYHATIEAAELALQRAKNLGKNRVVTQEALVANITR
ncbi:diguanylate cyclase [Vibrio sp. IRLE0018]|uniref:sensor domain-containing diguanylate cyclase n=1 Tax=Vibrio floridensis TaxID=2908007 RepID=UPI001F39AD59|nr:diguanylate cyclase [Vibrio floridensis]MCF8777204.1 diguanylate cyclase [Vibrio floridensis]